MCDGDFDPPGWRPDNECATDDGGSDRCGCLDICIGIGALLIIIVLF